MSDTPRTDAEEFELSYIDYGDDNKVVSSRVARTLELALAAKTAECDALKHDIERAITTNTELATECERLRDDATRTLWAVVFAAGGDVAVPHSLLISQDKQNILERIEYPSMTTVFKAARQETQ